MNKRIRYAAVIVAAAMVFAVTANAMTVNWSATGTSFLTLPGGTTGIAQGNLLKLGILTTTEANMIANKFDISYLNSHFNAWATGFVGDGTGVDGAFTEASFGPGAGYFNQQLYIMAYNNGLVPIGQTPVGLYTNPNWIAPSADNLSLSFDISDPGLHIAIGSFSAGTITSPAILAGYDAVWVGVPEPSSFVLAGLGLLGILGLIRRRSQSRNDRSQTGGQGEIAMKQLGVYTAVLLATVLCVTTGSAMTVAWSATATSFLTLPGGTTGVAQGSLLKLGTLTTTEANMVANQNSIAFLDSHFNTWATGFIGDGIGIDGAFTENSSGPGAAFFHQQLYMLAYNAPTAGAATTVGLYTNPNWIAPSDDSGLLIFDIVDPGLHIALGGFSAGTITTPSELAGYNAVQLNAVPEPSSFALAGLGLLGILGLIRRRR